MKIETIKDINLSNGSAILVGKNSSGKSTILERIRDESGWKKTSTGSINIDGISHTVFYVASDTSVDEAFTGKASIINKVQKVKLKDLNGTTPQPSTLFDATTLSTYETDLKTKAATFDVIDPMGTGIKIKYIPKIVKTNLVDLETVFEYAGRNYSLENVSTGIKSIVTLYMAQMNGALIGDNLLLIDEVDAFLHPEWIKLFSNLVCKLIDAGIKVILTTHSPLLVSSIAKTHPQLITGVKWGSTPGDGDIKAISWDAVFNSIRDELNSKPTFFGGVVKSLTSDDAKKYVSALLSTQICMMFFWDNPKFVEGPTEKVYLEQTTDKMFIASGGFHNFIIISFIMEAFAIPASFLMDTDFRAVGHIHSYNIRVHDHISAKILFNMYRISNTFDVFLSGGKVANYNKIPNAIASINSPPTDPHGDSTIVSDFIDK